MLETIGDSLARIGINVDIEPRDNPPGLPADFPKMSCDTGFCDFVIAVGFKPINEPVRVPSLHKWHFHNLNTGTSFQVK